MASAKEGAAVEMEKGEAEAGGTGMEEAEAEATGMGEAEAEVMAMRGEAAAGAREVASVAMVAEVLVVEGWAYQHRRQPRRPATARVEGASPLRAGRRW